jgi:hypothetical protein
MADERGQFRTLANEDGAIVLDTALGTISTLNRTGRYIWQALERGESQEAIVASLVRDTGESQQVVQRDVQEFLQALEQHRMIMK